MDVAITAVSFAVLGLVALYLATLSFGYSRQAVVVRRNADVERELLRARIGQIMDRRNFERVREELSWNGYRKFEIEGKEMEGGGICSFYLRPHDRKPLPPFEPGQYLTFNLHIANESKPTVRCYSLSDSPNHPEHYRVSIKALPAPRDNPDAPPGLSSNFFHDELGEGDILDVKAPSGKFFLDRSHHGPVVLIGGGVGITPVLSMLNDIVEAGSARDIWFFYGVTNGSEHIQKDHLKRLERENGNLSLHVCYSRAGDDDKEGEDFQHAERVSIDLFKRVLPHNSMDFYICGPPPMMNSLVEGLDEWGVPKRQIHFEAFGPATVKRIPAAEDAAQSAKGTAFKVTFAKSGTVANWTNESGSLLDLAEEKGVVMDFGCRAGNCGTCITAVKDGEFDYLNEPGDPPEAGSCLTCISVPKSNIVLDA